MKTVSNHSIYILQRMLCRKVAAQDFFCREFGVADIALYAYTHRADEGGFDLGPYPAIRSWLARVEDQPGYVEQQT